MFSDDRGGCLPLIIMGVCILLGMYIMSAGDQPKTGGTTTTSTTTTNTTNVQVNLFSAVNNGRILSNDQTTNTNNVSGDRSSIVDAGGTPMCLDPNSNTYTYAACGVRP